MTGLRFFDKVTTYDEGVRFKMRKNMKKGLDKMTSYIYVYAKKVKITVK